MGSGSPWEDRLSELADYRKIQGHCNVPENYSENTKLAKWIHNQRRRIRLPKEKTSSDHSVSSCWVSNGAASPPGKTV
jgi:hypothetical protein